MSTTTTSGVESSATGSMQSSTVPQTSSPSVSDQAYNQQDMEEREHFKAVVNAFLYYRLLFVAYLVL